MNAKTCKRIRREALNLAPNRRVKYIRLNGGNGLLGGTIGHKPGTFKAVVNRMKKEVA